MRSRILPVVGLSVAALALGTTFAPMATASHGVGSAGHTAVSQLSHTKASPAKTCYAQRDNDNGVGLISQNFESSLDAYDSQGADDFAVKKKCKIKSATADGLYFNGSGPADSYNVMFYKNKKGLPGKQVGKGCMNASYTDSTGVGTPTVKCKAKLKKGKYFVSIQANMNYSSGGEWGWNSNNTQRGAAAAWQNPGDGFATGCTSWGVMQTCLGAQGEGPDFSFSLQ